MYATSGCGCWQGTYSTGPRLVAVYSQLDWKTIGLAALDKGQAWDQPLLQRYSEVFGESLVTMHNFTAKLQV